MATRSEYEFLDWPTPIPFAHRGYSASAPENTMAAFDAAVAAGFRYLETDVRATSDGRPVLSHDSRLTRLADVDEAVESMTWNELQQIRIGGSEQVASLDELLTSWPAIRVNIDPKSDAAVEPLIAALRALRAVDRVCVGSFSQRRIDAVRSALGPTLCTSMGPVEAARLYLGSRLGLGRSFEAPCAQVPARRGPIPVIDRRLLDYAHDRGVAVHVWTVNEPEEMNELLDVGVDGVMTDRPLELRKVLERRGQWVADR
ncbi:glycerophosphodiester phosphodiesterase [Gordonia sp. NPDC003424]